MSGKGRPKQPQGKSRRQQQPGQPRHGAQDAPQPQDPEPALPGHPAQPSARPGPPQQQPGRMRPEQAPQPVQQQESAWAIPEQAPRPVHQPAGGRARPEQAPWPVQQPAGGRARPEQAPWPVQQPAGGRARPEQAPWPVQQPAGGRARPEQAPWPVQQPAGGRARPEQAPWPVQQPAGGRARPEQAPWPVQQPAGGRARPEQAPWPVQQPAGGRARPEQAPWPVQQPAGGRARPEQAPWPVQQPAGGRARPEQAPWPVQQPAGGRARPEQAPWPVQQPAGGRARPEQAPWPVQQPAGGRARPEQAPWPVQQPAGGRARPEQAPWPVQQPAGGRARPEQAPWPVQQPAGGRARPEQAPWPVQQPAGGRARPEQARQPVQQPAAAQPGRPAQAPQPVQQLTGVWATRGQAQQPVQQPAAAQPGRPAQAPGRARQPQEPAGPPEPKVPVGPPQAAPERPPGEPEVLGRGRPIGAAAAAASPSGEVMQVSAGFQDLSISERGGRRRDFHDLGVNTRLAMKHVKDSKVGYSGTPIGLTTNHIRIVSRPQWVLFQYHVDFNPPMEARRLRSALLFQHAELIGHARAFDGTILFLPKKLNKVTEVVSQTKNKETVKIKITLTNELPPTSPTCFQFYNIIFKRVLKIMNMKQIGRNYYYPNDAISIDVNNLTIWPGFTTSILQYETSIMLCIDVSHKVLRNETVLDIMTHYFNTYRSHGFQDACAKELLGQIVLTKYNNRTYRIDEVFWNMTPASTFKKFDGTDISFVEYYKTQYNIDINDMRQPLIANIPKRGKPGETTGPLVLIPELCNLTGLTDRMRSDFAVMKDLAVHTRVPPDQRAKSVMKFVDYIHRDESVQSELRDWGLNFDTKLLSLDGRVSIAEKINQQGQSINYNPQYADWSRELRGQNLISLKHLDSWMMLYTRRTQEAANILLQNLYKVTQQMGMRMNKALMLEVEDTPSSYMQMLTKNVTKHTQMVVCILSSVHKGKYDTIKRYLCADCPTPSQCVVAKTLSKPRTVMSVATKIALQMNCKMGGELWSVDMPLTDAMIIGIDIYHDTTSGKRSIAGFVASMNREATRWYSRCVVQDQRQEIVDGLKICMEAAFSSYYGIHKKLPKRAIVYRDGVGDGQLKTVVNYEVPQFLTCIRTLGESLKKEADPKEEQKPDSEKKDADPKEEGKPDSEKKDADPKKEEPDSERKEADPKEEEKTPDSERKDADPKEEGKPDLERKDADPKKEEEKPDLESTKLTVIVVKKRINARFFRSAGGRLQNPPPGTIVDMEVTRPEWYDFFIVSQAVREGTVTPTHYNVVYDDGGLSPDQIQRLTYKYCHLYYNWPGVIRVPAPCQYAHKLAFLVGQSIHKEPHTALSNLLYYL